MIRNTGLSLAIVLLAFLGGCATTVQLPGGEQNLSQTPPANWLQREKSLHGLTDWQLQGKLAVTQPKRSDTAIINQWRQHGATFKLAFSSTFMGLGSTQLSGDPSFVELTTSDGRNYVSAQPQKLLKQQLGWSLPLADLRFWIKGIPNPSQGSKLYFSDQGHLQRLEQGGWAVHFRRPKVFIAGLPALPSLITANKGKVRIRVAVLQWKRLPKDNTP